MLLPRRLRYVFGVGGWHESKTEKMWLFLLIMLLLSLPSLPFKTQPLSYMEFFGGLSKGTGRCWKLAESIVLQTIKEHFNTLSQTVLRGTH